MKARKGGGARFPMYFAGLLLGLAALVAIFYAKRSMMPRFHEISETLPEAAVAPGASIRIVYSEEPGYFLIPGLPTGAILSRKEEGGKITPLFQLKYAALVEKEPLIGPVTEEGKYLLDADFYICAEAGVAYCSKYSVTRDLIVERNATMGELRLEVDLRKLAEEGLKAGNLSEDKPHGEPVKDDKVQGEE